MNTLTTADLKLIADEMGKKLTKLISSEQIEYFISDNSGDLILWNPVESTDQCLEVLEWLKPLTIFYKDGEWTIGKGTDNAIWVSNPNFKLAVCLAAVEWIKQSKK